MQTILESLERLLAVWEKAVDVFKKPLAVLVLIGMLVAAAFFYGQYQRDNGYAQAKKDDAKLEASLNGQIKQLNIEKNSLQKRLDTFDCADQTEKWSRVFQSLTAVVKSRKKDAESSLEAERRRTEAIEQTLNSL